MVLPLAHLSSLVSLAWSHVSLNNCVHMQVHVVVVLMLCAYKCQFQFGFREWFICVIYYHINVRMPPMMVLKHVLLHRVLDSYC